MVWVDKGALAVLSDAAVAAMVEGATATRGRVDARAVAAVAVSEAGEPARIASQLSSPTAARSAVDARIRDQAEGMVGDVILSNPAVTQAVIDRIEANPALLGQLAWSKGHVPEGSDLEDLAEGNWTVSSANIARSITSQAGALPAPETGNIYKTSNGNVIEWTPLAGDGRTYSTVKRAVGWMPWVRVDAGAAAEIGPLPSDVTSIDNFVKPGTWYITPTTVVGGLPVEGRYLTLENRHWRVNPPYNGITQVVRVEQGTYESYERTRTLDTGQWSAYQRTASVNASADWAPLQPVSTWGDSAVTGWPEELGRLLVTPVTNRGMGSFTVNDALLRAGVMRQWATPVGGSIPASGPVEVDFLGAKWTSRQTYGRTVRWKGVLGWLLGHDDGRWTFGRSANGAVVTFDGPEELVEDGTMDGTGTHIFMMGGNDWLPGHGAEPDVNGKVEHVISAYLRAIEAVSLDGERHVLVAGVKTRQGTQIGDENHEWTLEINDRLRTQVPQYFISRQDWLVERSLAVLGITPTAADEALMAAGVIPPGAFVDVTHTKPELEAAEAAELWLPPLALRGWVVPNDDGLAVLSG